MRSGITESSQNYSETKRKQTLLYAQTLSDKMLTWRTEASKRRPVFHKLCRAAAMPSATIVTMITRRSFLKCGVAASATLALPWTVRQAFASRPTRSLLKKYIQHVPLPGSGIVVATPSGANQYSFTEVEIARQLHPHLPPTPLFAYDDGSGLAGQAGSVGMAVGGQSGHPATV